MDNPIKAMEEDQFQRDRFAKRIVRALIEHNSRHSRQVVVGITGEWGSGKSSILNFIEKEIKAEFPEAVVMAFNPWLVNSAND